MKFVSIALCLIMLVVAIVFVPGNSQKIAMAGPGNGENEKIKSPESFSELMMFVARDDSYDLSNSQNSDNGQGIMLLSYGSYTNKSDEKKEYDSVTIHEDARMLISSSYASIKESKSQKYTLSRRMDVYLTEDATYYHSIGLLTSKYSYRYSSDDAGSSSNEALYFDFDVEIYLDKVDGKNYFKINKWVMAGSDTVKISDELIGKWFTTNARFNLFSQLDMFNRDSFEQLGEVVDYATGSDDLHETRNNMYTVPEDELLSILGVSESDIKTHGSFKLDLTDNEAPLVSMQLSYGTEYVSCSTDVSYQFENINNTVIKMNDNVEIMELDDDELDDYIMYN